MKRLIPIIFAMLILLTACGKNAAAKWQEQYDLGVRYMSEGNYEEAIIAFNAAIKIDPKREEGYVSLADVYYAMDEPEKAEEILAQLPERETDEDMAGISTEKELIKRLGYADGSYVIYEYDFYGNRIRETAYNADGLKWLVIDYNTDGNIVRETKYNGDGTIAHYQINDYNDSGSLVRATTYNGDDTIDYFYINDYDGSGNNVRTTAYASDGSTEETYIYEYDMSGTLVRDIRYYGDGTLHFITDYDAFGCYVRRTIYNPDGTVDYVQEF